MKRLLAGALTAGLVGSLGSLGHGVASADETVYTIGGAKMPGVPWYEYTDRSGRGYYPSTNRVLVDYPAGIFTDLLPKGEPGVGPSVQIGANSLDELIHSSTGGPAVAVGLSEGSLVVNEEQARLLNDPNAPPPSQLSFATFGDPAGRHGWGQSFLTSIFPPGTVIPLIDYAIPAPVETQYDTTRVVTAYDGISDFPDRPANVVSLANALLGSIFYHTGVAFGNRGDVPPQNIRTTVNSRGAKTITYLVPTQFLPLTFPLRMAGLPEETIVQLEAMLRPMVDAGYSRNDNPFTRPNAVDPVRGLPAITDTSSVVEANLDGFLGGIGLPGGGGDSLAGLAPMLEGVQLPQVNLPQVELPQVNPPQISPPEVNLDGVVQDAQKLLPPAESLLPRL